MSTMAIEEMTSEYRRARRNILLISALLMFAKYGQLSMESISVLGARVTVGNPQAIYVAAWISWFYFLMSYIQYFNQEGRGRLRGPINHSLTFTIGIKMADRICAIYPNAIIQKPVEYAHLKTGAFMRRRYKGTAYGKSADNGGDQEQIEVDVELNLWEFKWELVKASFDFIFKKSATFEYLLPFAVILSTMFYCTMGSWAGSISQLLGLN